MYVIEPALAGGAETVVRRLAGGAHRRGADVEVATLLQSRGEHPLVDLLRQDGLLVAEVRCGRRRLTQEEAKGAERSLEERFGIDQWLDRVYAIYRKVCGT